MQPSWSGKRYHTWNYHLRQVFGEKVAKISLDGGFSCPHRDTAGQGGCIFCSPRGSGDCAGDRDLPLSRQFAMQSERTRRKWPGVSKYIVYFQAYTNTHGPVPLLESRFRTALAQPGVVGMSVSTRPDCLPPAVLDLLARLNRETWLWVELGLQTIHDPTLARINRGHNYACFVDALKDLRSRAIRVCPHIILGLPGEDRKMNLETGSALAAMPIQGLKIHMLHVIRRTPLARLWEEGKISLPDMACYVQGVVDILEMMPPSVVVQRVTGDAPGEILVAPLWIRRKWEVLQAIDAEFVRRGTWQGKKFSPGG